MRRLDAINGLPTPTAGFTDLEAVAKAMGISKAMTVRTLSVRGSAGRSDERLGGDGGGG